jgi:hypothetical protein
MVDVRLVEQPRRDMLGPGRTGPSSVPEQPLQQRPADNEAEDKSPAPPYVAHEADAVHISPVFSPKD